MKKHLYLIDGTSLIFRTYYALPKMNNKKGLHINALLGFSNIIIKILQEVKKCYLAIIFDSKNKKFRHKIYNHYKSNRKSPPKDLINQFSLIKRICKVLSISQMEQKGFEADDLIATYVKSSINQDINIIIISSDKDMMQLIKTKIYIFNPSNSQIFTKYNVINKFKLEAKYIPDIQALSGDYSDNIPGIPGVGLKNAVKLIKNFKSLDNLLNKKIKILPPTIKNNIYKYAEKARISKKLVVLKDDVAIPNHFNNFLRYKHNNEKLIYFLKNFGLNNILQRLRKKNFNLGLGGVK